MTATSLRPRRPASPVPPRRKEQAAIEAGRWLRRTGRVSLPVRTRPRGEGAAPRSG